MEKKFQMKVLMGFGTGKQCEDDLLARPREPGVGAELNQAFDEIRPQKAKNRMSSLPDITAELDRCEICSVATTSSAVSEKDGTENVYEDLEEVTIVLQVFLQLSVFVNR